MTPGEFRSRVEDLLVELDAGDAEVEYVLDSIEELHTEHLKEFGVSALNLKARSSGVMLTAEEGALIRIRLSEADAILARRGAAGFAPS